jgi:hypothetical protein
VAGRQAWFCLAFEHCVKGGDGELIAWLSRGGECRRDQRGEIHIIEADNADIFGHIDVVLMQPTQQ